MSLFFSKNGSSVPPHSIVFFFFCRTVAPSISGFTELRLHNTPISLLGSSRLVTLIYIWIIIRIHRWNRASFGSLFFLFVLLFFCFLFCASISHRYEIGFSKCGGVWKFRNPLNLGRVRASPNIDGIFLRSSKLRKRERLVLFRHRTDATNKSGGGHQICRLPQT